MVTTQLLLLTMVQILPSMERLSYRNRKYQATTDQKKTSPLPPFKFVRNVIGKLEFRMNISKPIGCVEFKKYLDEMKPGVFHIWPKFQIRIIFIGGKDFAIAFHESKGSNPTHAVAMLMG
ncbi:hypothetical protein ACRRTK_024440 [Alexandromys fortis]